MNDEEYPMDKRRVLHIGGSIQPALLMAALGALLAAEEASRRNRGIGMLIVDHRNVDEARNQAIDQARDTMELEFTKMKYVEYEGSYIGSKCKICGRDCIGKDKFCSKNHEFMWKRRGR